MRERALVKFFNALYQKCCGGTEENHAVLWRDGGKSGSLVEIQRKIMQSLGGREKMIEKCRGREENYTAPCARRKSCYLVEEQRKIMNYFSRYITYISIGLRSKCEITRIRK
jgi:hypothetical protein